MGFLELEKDGNSLSGDGESILDLNPEFDCLWDLSATASGRLTADDAFNLTEGVVAQINSGTECNQSGITFPCSTEFSFHAEK